MSNQRVPASRFDLRTDHFEKRTNHVNSLLKRFNIVGATGSILEAHLLVRLGLNGGIPNLLGCGIDPKEVSQLCSNENNILLFMTESIASDYGAGLITTLRKECKSVKIIYLIQDPINSLKIEGFDVDAIVLCTSFGSGAIASALTEISSGCRYLDPAFLHILSERKIVLTRREQQVLQHLQVGLTNKEISARLSVSPVTIRDYVQNLMMKLNASNRTMVVANAQKEGLI